MQNNTYTLALQPFVKGLSGRQLDLLLKQRLYFVGRHVT
jgi:hypothetical protein